MAPKVKVTREKIIETALSLVKSEGEGSLNARSVANALNCSTQPLFSNFQNVLELKTEVIELAYKTYLEFIENEINSQKYPQYKSMGMAYIRFAKDEPNLFKMLFMCDRTDEEFSHTEDFEKAVELIMSANGISKEKATLFHLELWAFVHGIASMIATSYLNFDWELISNMLSDVYQGLRGRALNDCN